MLFLFFNARKYRHNTWWPTLRRINWRILVIFLSNYYHTAIDPPTPFTWEPPMLTSMFTRHGNMLPTAPKNRCAFLTITLWRGCCAHNCHNYVRCSILSGFPIDMKKTASFVIHSFLICSNIPFAPATYITQDLSVTQDVLGCFTITWWLFDFWQPCRLATHAQLPCFSRSSPKN